MNVAMSQKPFVAITYETTESNKTGSWRFFKPRYQDKTSPCSAGCPAGEDIGMIEMLAKQGLFKEAWEKILRENPLPGVCGRVCFHPCESVCNRQDFDSPIAIHAVEWFLADAAAGDDFTTTLEKLPQKNQRIAIIGSGPAGLSAAWFLTMLGYPCDIFEALPEAGGILRWGIPEYRLPLAVLQSEIARIESQGVRMITKKAISSESFSEIRKSYSAVFLGCGQSRNTPLGITGETPESLKDGLDFLRRVRQGERPFCDGFSVVIGGGNTAIDVARTITRFGGNAAILYRRRRQDMPASGDEIAMALEEGVKLEELVAPSAIEHHGSRFRLLLRKMKIEGQDKDGRGRIVFDGKKTVKRLADHVFMATGTEAAEPWYSPPLAQRGVMGFSHCVLLLEDGGAPVIYGGDLTNETKNVAQAIASGKQAAVVLDTYFERGIDQIKPRLETCRVGNGPALSMEAYLEGSRGLRSPHIVQYEEINTDYFHFETRAAQPRLSLEVRRGSFNEIDLKIDVDSALREAGRCFNCGLCDECDNCYVFCPDAAIIRGKHMENRHINYDYCKGCGVCAAECPRNAVIMGEEGL
jgi:2-oxoacid:acceptor oxidoreductase delta subunit (pyruvate/2-ketoisovalerate family)